MGAKIYFLITFLVLFWTYCLYWGFKNQRKATTPVNFFIFDRQLPSWAFIAISTGTVFSGWIFFAHPGLIFMNGLPFAITSLAAIVIPLIGIIFLKRQWMLSKRFGFVTPCEMLGEYFKSDIIRILIVLITLLFAIPFIAMQLSLVGNFINILSDDVIGTTSASILVGSIILIYLSLSGIKSSIYIDSVQFLLIIFGIIAIGFITYNLVGGWDLLNESLSRVSRIKENLFNIKENYNSYLAVPGTIKLSKVLDEALPYSGIWTSSMILTFTFALAGIQLSPNFSMLAFSAREVKSFGAQQVWFSAFFVGFILIFFSTAIGVGSILLGGNDIVNQSGNNISNLLPKNIFPNNASTVVPHLVNIIGDYSGIFFGILAICGVAAVQATANFYLSSSAIVTRDIIKRFFVKNLNNQGQIFTSRILLMAILIVALIISTSSSIKIFALGSFSLAIACQMFVPLLALCYFPWLTKQGVSLGIILGIVAVILTDSTGQSEIFSNAVKWNKWPLTIHSSVWGLFFNLAAAITISFITQDQKETNHKERFHNFINDYKSVSLARRSLKPSAWIVAFAWMFFAIGPGLIVGNEFFGRPGNVESWSFGMPSIWVWKIIFWVLGVILIWFLAFKMEMSTSPTKTIVAQTDDVYK